MLSGKSDQHLYGRAPGPQLLEDIHGRLQCHVPRLTALTPLARIAPPGVSRRRPPPSRHVGRSGRLERVPLELGRDSARRSASARTVSPPRREDQRHVGAAPACLVGDGDAHAPARSIPDVADGVDRLAGAAGRDQHRTRSGSARWRAAPRRPRRSRPAPTSAPPPLALRRVAVAGADELDAACRQQAQVLGRRLGLPHARVHRRGRHDRPRERERRRGRTLAASPWAMRESVVAESGVMRAAPRAPTRRDAGTPPARRRPGPGAARGRRRWSAHERCESGVCTTCTSCPARTSMRTRPQVL